MKGKIWLAVSFLVLILSGCSHKKKVSLSGEEPVDISDFIKTFEPLSLPYQIADTSVVKKTDDTLLISHKVLNHFIPDSVLYRILGKTERSKMYPLGRISSSDGGTYIFIKTLSADYKSIILLCFDRKNKFIAGMPVLVPDTNPATQQYFNIDKTYTLSKGITRRNVDGITREGKNVYVLNEPARSFLLIMTSALDEQKVDLINPIESLPRKNKYSGDYVRDKWNLVSIRDDKKQSRIAFFVHFEKKNNCTGELKGEAGFTSANTAIYRSGGDFCMLQFDFTSSSVTITELEGCGSHRGVDCAFQGTFPKKKEIKKKEIKKPQKKLIK
ncbi:MAG: hypothetical protein ACHQF0_07925 [Chitinophagales bacterium]